jgi:predicted membrane protein
MKIKVMETYKNKNSGSNKLGGGLILLVIGLIFFLRNLGIGIPHWVFSWHTILLAIGLLIGYRRNFTGGGWMVMVLVGSIFTLQDIADLNLSKYYFAGAFIIMGLYLILKPIGAHKGKWKKKPLDFNLEENPDAAEVSGDEDEYIDSVNIFGGSKQQVFYKKLKGGDIVSVFGGCDLNLTQADFEGAVTLDIIAIFGGVKIIIPPTWVVKTELTSIMGGVDDKRALAPTGEGPYKVLKVTGVAIFGGVDIRNY